MGDRDVARAEGGFAVGEVVGPFAHEAVVEAEGADLVGAVAEAFYGGVPEALWETVLPMLPDEFLSVIDAFEDRYLGF